jgi:hypothetical protein
MRWLFDPRDLNINVHNFFYSIEAKVLGPAMDVVSKPVIQPWYVLFRALQFLFVYLSIDIAFFPKK